MTSKRKSKAAKEQDARWDDAIDWLLNSRHTADRDIQDPFWAYVDGWITRDELDEFTSADVRERRELGDLDPDTEMPKGGAA